MSSKATTGLARLFVVLVLITISFPLPASADPWGTQTADTGAHPDGGGHNYCYYQFNPPSADFQTNLEQVIAHSLVYHTNVPYSNFDDPCDTSGSPQTDIRWISNDLDGTVTGQAPCAVYYTSSDHCDRYNVTIDELEVSEGANDEWDESQTACHELGHTVGLSHGTQDCMMSGEPPDGTDQWNHYGTAHHVPDHIDTWFVE